MNNQGPYGFFPGNQGPSYPYPNQPSGQCNCTNQIRSINNQINNLERQINRLERRVRRLENATVTPTPYGANNSDFSGSYNQENYII